MEEPQTQAESLVLALRQLVHRVQSLVRSKASLGSNEPSRLPLRGLARAASEPWRQTLPSTAEPGAPSSSSHGHPRFSAAAPGPSRHLGNSHSSHNSSSGGSGSGSISGSGGRIEGGGGESWRARARAGSSGGGRGNEVQLKLACLRQLLQEEGQQSHEVLFSAASHRPWLPLTTPVTKPGSNIISSTTSSNSAPSLTNLAGSSCDSLQQQQQQQQEGEAGSHRAAGDIATAGTIAQVGSTQDAACGSSTGDSSSSTTTTTKHEQQLPQQQQQQQHGEGWDVTEGAGQRAHSANGASCSAAAAAAAAAKFRARGSSGSTSMPAAGWGRAAKEVREGAAQGPSAGVSSHHHTQPQQQQQQQQQQAGPPEQTDPLVDCLLGQVHALMREKNNLHATMRAMADEYCKLKEQIEFLLLPDVDGLPDGAVEEDDQNDLLCSDHSNHHSVARSQSMSGHPALKAGIQL